MSTWFARLVVRPPNNSDTSAVTVGQVIISLVGFGQQGPGPFTHQDDEV